MKRSDSPAKQGVAFGVNGTREALLDTAQPTSARASYDSGFPPITMLAKTAGGLPPQGPDFNQILYELSDLGRWGSAGALQKFDSTFSTAISGYPEGAMLLSDNGDTIYISTADDNTANPNSDTTGWKALGSFLDVDDTLRTQLASSSTGEGASLVSMSDGNTVEQEIASIKTNYITNAQASDALSLYPKKTDLSSTEDGYGDALIGVKQPYSDAVAKNQHVKNSEILTVSDFSSLSSAVSAAISSSQWLYNSDQTFTLTVGSGGQFSKLTDAINAACKLRPTYSIGNDFCEIQILSGFVLSEQIEFHGGVDLSWIKITSVDSVVYADTSAFTETYFGYAEYKYLFSFSDLAKSPVFGFLIQDNRTTSSDVVAFLVNSGSSLYFSAGSGARYFLRGVEATYGSNVIGLMSGNGSAPATGYFLCDFSYCVEACLVAMLNCRVNLPYSLFENCPGDSVACVWSTVAEFRYSSVSNCTGTGWIVRDGAVVSIRDHKSIKCGVAGLKAYHGALINARCHQTNDDGTITDTSVLDGFYGCTIGAAIDSSCSMDVSGTDMRNCGTALYAYRGCSFVAHSCNFDGSTLVAQGNTKCDFSLTSGSALNVNNICSMQNMSNFVTWTFKYTVTTSTGTRYVDLRTMSKASFNSVTIDTNSSLWVENASEASFVSCTIGALRVASYYGSRVNIQDSSWNFSRVVSGTNILNVARGSTISAIGQRGTNSEALTYNITPLSLNTAGIIYYS